MARSSLKYGYYAALSLAGVDRLRRLLLAREKKIAVLNLHRVSADPSPYWPPMRPQLFEELLKYLAYYFDVRSLREIGEKQGKKPIAVLSFDDGYYDFADHALPLLKRYSMPANLNVIPQCAETGRPIWNVRLYDFLAAAPKKLIDQIDLEGFDQKLASDDEASKVRFGIAVSKFLKTRPRAEREDLFRSVELMIQDHQVPGTRMLTTGELRQISADVEIGAHSYSHESMGFEPQRFFEEDLEKCCEYFRTKLEIPLDIYAFPNGSYRNEQIDHLRRKGVGKILLVDEKFAEQVSDVLTRITMYGDSPAEVRMRSVGF